MSSPSTGGTGGGGVRFVPSEGEQAHIGHILRTARAMQTINRALGGGGTSQSPGQALGDQGTGGGGQTAQSSGNGGAAAAAAATLEATGRRGTEMSALESTMATQPAMSASTFATTTRSRNVLLVGRSVVRSGPKSDAPPGPLGVAQVPADDEAESTRRELPDLSSLTWRDYVFFFFDGFPTVLYRKSVRPLVRASEVWANVMFLFVMVSCFSFATETLPDYYDRRLIAFTVIEAVCIAVFTVDFMVRILLTRSRLAFVASVHNWIDLVSIAPFYIALVIDEADTATALVFFRSLRLMRVFRILKLSKKNIGLQAVIEAMSRSGEAISLMALLLLIATVLFSSAAYFAEMTEAVFDEQKELWVYEADGRVSPFQSIFHAMWWCLVTMTTVGYGDDVPRTPAGKFVGAITMISGVFVLAFPTVILSTNFQEVHQAKIDEQSRLQADLQQGDSDRSSSDEEEDFEDDVIPPGSMHGTDFAARTVGDRISGADATIRSATGFGTSKSTRGTGAAEGLATSDTPGGPVGGTGGGFASLPSRLSAVSSFRSTASAGADESGAAARVISGSLATTLRRMNRNDRQRMLVASFVATGDGQAARGSQVATDGLPAVDSGGSGGGGTANSNGVTYANAMARLNQRIGMAYDAATVFQYSFYPYRGRAGPAHAGHTRRHSTARLVDDEGGTRSCTLPFAGQVASSMSVSQTTFARTGAATATAPASRTIGPDGAAAAERRSERGSQVIASASDAALAPVSNPLAMAAAGGAGPTPFRQRASSVFIKEPPRRRGSSNSEGSGISERDADTRPILSADGEGGAGPRERCAGPPSATGTFRRASSLFCAPSLATHSAGLPATGTATARPMAGAAGGQPAASNMVVSSWATLLNQSVVAYDPALFFEVADGQGNLLVRVESLPVLGQEVVTLFLVVDYSSCQQAVFDAVVAARPADGAEIPIAPRFVRQLSLRLDTDHPMLQDVRLMTPTFESPVGTVPVALLCPSGRSILPVLLSNLSDMRFIASLQFDPPATVSEPLSRYSGILVGGDVFDDDAEMRALVARELAAMGAANISMSSAPPVSDFNHHAATTTRSGASRDELGGEDCVDGPGESKPCQGFTDHPPQVHIAGPDKSSEHHPEAEDGSDRGAAANEELAGVGGQQPSTGLTAGASQLSRQPTREFVDDRRHSDLIAASPGQGDPPFQQVKSTEMSHSPAAASVAARAVFSGSSAGLGATD